MRFHRFPFATRVDSRDAESGKERTVEHKFAKLTRRATLNGTLWQLLITFYVKRACA